MLLALSALLAAGGCTAARHEVFTPAVLPGQRGVVIAVDGAGGFQATSTALREAVEECRLPLSVATFHWTHGYGRILSDQIDRDHALAEGCRLAGEVARLRRCCPGGEIYLVGHSAGSGVVLTAAEALPAGSVDRIILLSPSVSDCYDLRPALRCTRQTLEAFYSERDLGYLGVGIAVFGTADRLWGYEAAGRVGFQPVVQTPEDACLYAKLRQHPWDPCVSWTGNRGGHYGGYQPGHLKAFVLPLLCRCP